MVAFTGLVGNEENSLDGIAVKQINADLTGGLDTTRAALLSENKELCFRGTEMHGAFDLDAATAEKMLSVPANPNGRTNADVIRRYINALDITQREGTRYVIDFGTTSSVTEAALYELPFEYIKHHVLPARSVNRRETRKARWWLHGETNPGMRQAVTGLSRYIATPRVAKHRIFRWVDRTALPDSALCVFARDDDYFFGILHSTAHEVWARTQGTQLRDAESGFRYTPLTCFATFPFPWPPNAEPTSGPELAQKEAIAEAARHLVELRDRWLNPPNTPKADLKKRTLTNLYTQRPTWLADAHRALDEAVFAAYGWPATLTTPEILARLLALNHERAAAQQAGVPLSRAKARKEA